MIYTKIETVPVKLKGVGKSLYAYRVGEGSNKERVVVSNISAPKLDRRSLMLCKSLE